MMTRILCLSCLLLISNSFLYAQKDKKLDSLLEVNSRKSADTSKIKTLQALFTHLRHQDAQRAFAYNKQSLELSNQLNFSVGQGVAYLNMAYYYRFLPNLDSSRYCFEKSMDILKKADKKKHLWTTLNEYATLETLQGNFKKALDLADEGEKIAKELHSSLHLVDNLQRKATIYMDTGDFDLSMKEVLKASRILDTISPPNPKRKAVALADIGRIEMLRGNYYLSLEPLEKSLEIFKNIKDDQWIATIYIEIGNVYWYLNDYDSSLKNYEESLAISYRMNRDDYIAANLTNMGLILQDMKQYDKAIDYLLKGNAVTKKIGSINNLIISHNDIGTAYFKNGEFENSIINHNRAIKMADSIKALDILGDGYLGRSRSYEKMGNYEQALSDQRNYQKINDSVFNIQKAKQIDELKTQYETEKKEQQIILLEQEAKVSQLQKALLGGGLGLSVLVLGFGFYGVRQKLKRNKAEKEKVDAELAFKKKELTTHALHLAKKNEVLEGLKQKAEELKKEEASTKGYQQLIRTINFDLQDDTNWKNFSHYFEQVHKDFNKNVKTKFPDITSNELRLLALMKMNLSSKEIANILNISQEGIKKARYRLRKKLNIVTEDSLQDLVLNL
ncbi:MAG: tetratricopeptide repeat protein [Muricauda sp.]|nr:tetratricopeptide repeat protein [Allomuricauda sp.]